MSASESTRYSRAEPTCAARAAVTQFDASGPNVATSTSFDAQGGAPSTTGAMTQSSAASASACASTDERRGSGAAGGMSARGAHEAAATPTKRAETIDRVLDNGKFLHKAIRHSRHCDFRATSSDRLI